VDEMIACFVEQFDSGISSDPDTVIGILQKTRDKITSEGIFFQITMLKICGPDAVVQSNPVACADPDISPAVLQEMIRDILYQAVLDIQLFEVIIRICILALTGQGKG
jgi:hypothetical protein